MEQPILSTRHLTKKFGSLTAVQDLSLDINEGEVFGLLGPNGAGKTTLINMICGLIKPDSGSVSLYGEPITDGKSEVRGKIGVCPQNTVFWGNLTCREQLKFIGEMYGMKSRTVDQRVTLVLKELDLESQRNHQAHLLSGGLQRRLNLALALVHDPAILVLDEPEAGLDPQSRLLVREYLRSLTSRKTIVLTTHNMDEAERLVDRVAIIDHGRLLVLDTPEALKQRLGLGDVLEIRLNPPLPGDDPSMLQTLVENALKGFSGRIILDAPNQLIHIRLLNAVSQLSGIMESLNKAGFLPGQVSLRANSLEDVFISLTGRTLRE